MQGLWNTDILRDLTKEAFKAFECDIVLSLHNIMENSYTNIIIHGFGVIYSQLNCLDYALARNFICI